MKANGLVLTAGSAIGTFLRFLVGELLASESSLAFRFQRFWPICWVVC